MVQKIIMFKPLQDILVQKNMANEQKLLTMKMNLSSPDKKSRISCGWRFYLLQKRMQILKFSGKYYSFYDDMSFI